MNHPAFPYAFIAAEHDQRHLRVVQIDARGQLVKQFACTDYPLDLALASDGRLLLTMQTSLLEIDPTWTKVLWRWDTNQVLVAACQYLPNGNLLAAHTGLGQVLELDGATREIVRFVDIPRAPDLAPDYALFRIVRQIGADRLLIAMHHDRKIAEFDWNGELHWQASVEGTPYMPLRLSNGHTLVSCGPSGRIVEIDRNGRVAWHYDMVRDSGLARGWIAGIELIEADDIITFSVSRHDQLIALDRRTKEIRGLFHRPDLLIHPSTHLILPS